MRAIAFLFSLPRYALTLALGPLLPPTYYGPLSCVRPLELPQPILRGKLDPNKAFTMRKLKIRGNLLQLLRGSDSTLRWVAILQTIPSEFEGEYAQYNFGAR